MATHTDIACRLPSQGEARRTLLKEGLLKRVQLVRELSDGYALRFEWSPERIGELAEFVALESECCAFLRFRLEVEPGEGPVWLCLTGSSEAKAFLREGSDLLPNNVQMDRHHGLGRIFKGGSVAPLLGGLGLVPWSASTVSHRECRGARIARLQECEALRLESAATDSLRRRAEDEGA